MMKSVIRSMLAGAVLAAGSLSLHAGQAPQPKTSPALAETFLAADNAWKAKRYAEAIAKAREVLANPRKTPDDVYAANSYIMQAAQGQKDMRTMVTAMEGMLESGFSAGPAVQNQTRKAVASAHFQLKNYPEAIKHGTELIRAGAADDAVYTVVGQSYYQTRNYGEAVKLFGGMVAEDEKAGRRPNRNQLSLLYSAHDKTGNAEAAQATLEKLVRYYPTSDTWLVLLYEVKREKLEPRQKLHLYRLMESTGNLKEAADVMAYSEAATNLKLHSEAHRVLAAGLKANAFAKAADTERQRAERYAASASRERDAIRAELPTLQAQAKAAPTGEEYVSLGMQQLSFEMYPEAVESLQAGIAKGGVKNLVDAQASLGYAQLKAGQKAEAVKTFRAIKAADGTTQRIVKFWTLHAQ